MKDLDKIIESRKLNKRKLAEALFPDADHPLMTIARVIKGVRDLTAAEYRTLSEIIDVPIGFLISQEWLIHTDHPHELSFLKGDVICKLNTKTWLTVIHTYRDGAYVPTYSVKAENAPLSVFLADITALVINKKVNNLKSIK